MTFTIEMGWWLAPFAVTVATFIAVTVFNQRTATGGGGLGGAMEAGFHFMFYMIGWVVPSLIAWLVWALLR